MILVVNIRELDFWYFSTTESSILLVVSTVGYFESFNYNAYVY